MLCWEREREVRSKGERRKSIGLTSLLDWKKCESRIVRKLQRTKIEVRKINRRKLKSTKIEEQNKRQHSYRIFNFFKLHKVYFSFKLSTGPTLRVRTICLSSSFLSSHLLQGNPHTFPVAWFFISYMLLETERGEENEKRGNDCKRDIPLQVLVFLDKVQKKKERAKEKQKKEDTYHFE